MIEALTLAIVIGSALLYLRQEGRKQIELRAHEVGSLLRVAIGESLMVHHYASVEEIVDVAFQDLTDIDYLLALDADGEVLAVKRRGKDLDDDDDHIAMTQDVLLGETRLGTVLLRYSTDYLLERARRQGQTMALWGVLGMMASAVMTWMATTRLTRGLIQVTRRLQAVADGHHASPLPAKPGTELGRLVDSYNAAIANLTRRPA